MDTDAWICGICLCLWCITFGNGIPLNPPKVKNVADDTKAIDDAIDSDNLRPLENDQNKNNVLKFEPLKDIRKDENLSLDKLKPVDHIDALKMEHDGHINKEYHKELFLGNHEQFEKDGEDSTAKLLDIFFRVDSDKDGHLSEAEMEAWIMQKMDEHFDEALQENEEIFKHLDPDGNGLVHWKEYYTHFLLAKGYDDVRAKKHVQDYDEIELDSDAKEELVRYKFRWTDADLDPADNQLNKTEFLGFRHPEQSDKTISTMVSSIMNSMDSNEDGWLSLSEFIALPPGEVEGDDFREMDIHWQEERKAEFSDAIDQDKNGHVTAMELKAYLDPRNPVQALMESRNLISLMDEDKDKMVSKDEMLKHKDIFISSKVVDFAANVHDEF
ncbi:45 kDa calcium-binding protein-like [Haliotis rufescens]|uniref:45 kDa calcium-binding protein-like n=1 Tax=Haliotis rufescens TaxID=6454 RepID=UPI00201EEAC4|nr:45 kDa calcium-binding protein-like [Haliotis rufescens]